MPQYLAYAVINYGPEPNSYEWKGNTDIVFALIGNGRTASLEVADACMRKKHDFDRL